MSKHVYHLQLNRLEGAEGQPEAVAFDFESHDDVFKIIGFIKEKGLFADEQEAMQFAVGLKMFSGVLMKNRSNDLFQELEPAFAAFMKKLKGRQG